MKIGYIGLGAMGNALARRLVSANSVLVWDVNPKAVTALVEVGAGIAANPRELAAECEMIFLCLPRSADVESVIFGPEGLMGGLRPGTLVIDQTSGTPAATSGFAGKLADRGIGFIDAPVAGGVPQAIAGTVAIMVSGADRDLARAMPILRKISPRIFRCSGRVGDAQATKLVNNCINSGYRMATLELVALGRKLGLSLPVLAEILNKSWGSNFTAKRLLPSLVQGLPSTNFALSLMLKDVNQCLAIGSAVGVPMPLSNLTRGLMQIGQNLLTPHASLDEIVDAMERLTSSTIRDANPEDAAPDEEKPFDGSCIGICGAERLSPDTLASFHAQAAVTLLTDRDVAATATRIPVIDFTRRSPGAHRDLATKLSARGASLVDIASAAEQTGEITNPEAWLCGGSPAAFAAARPVIEAVSGKAIHCGPPGSGRFAELIVGAAALCNRAVMQENASVGIAFGLEADAMATALNEGSGWSAEGARVLDGIAADQPTSKATLGTMVEDMNELRRLAMASDTPLFIAGAVHASLEVAMVRSGPNATLDELAPR